MMRRPRFLQRLRETQPKRGPQPRKKRKMAMVTGNLEDGDDVGPCDGPHMGSRSGAFELVA